MAIRKNKKRIDPRYFLNETTHRGLSENQQAEALLQRLRDPKSADGSPGLGDQNYWQQRADADDFAGKNAPLATSIVSIYNDLKRADAVNSPDEFLAIVPHEWQKPHIKTTLMSVGAYRQR